MSHLVTSEGVRTAAVTLLSDRELDTLALWQRDPWLLLSDDTARLLAPQFCNVTGKKLT